MLSDSTRDHCPSEGSDACREQLVGSDRIRSANRGGFTNSNSERFHWTCRLPMSAGCHREHESLENQAGLPGTPLRFAILGNQHGASAINCW
jgi:hypothetical protein